MSALDSPLPPHAQGGDLSPDLSCHPDTCATFRALLVEDDDLDADILASVAGTATHMAIHFTRAKSLGEAIRLMAQAKFDLYFVDFRLGDGVSLRLLTTLEQSGARAIVLSNMTRREAEKLRLDGGGLRFLSKLDCSPASLFALVSDALQLHARPI